MRTKVKLPSDVRAGQIWIKLPVQAPEPRMAAPLLFVLLVSIFSGCAHEKIVYKCPGGQVPVLEDAGLPTEAERCYTPGTSYTDYRAMSTKRLKNLSGK